MGGWGVKKVRCKKNQNKTREMETVDDGGVTVGPKTEVKQIRMTSLKVSKPVCYKVASVVVVGGGSEPRQAAVGAEGRRGAWSAAKTLPASRANERKRERCSFGGQNLLFWCQREARCQITSAVV